MKVKEIDRTANIAWSPAAHHPIYLAAGTAAQQLDATFSTTAALEIYGLNLTEPGLDMSLKGNIVSDYRFHKIVWGSGGMSNGEHVSGVLVGGADGGNLLAYDPAKLLKGESALICHSDKHTGPINSLDFNNFQPNLLASGAAESEIFIWDLNNPNTPMTPGAKSQPAEVVTCVAWNRQVQHILASTFSAKCVVWDLRKNEPIIKVSDTTSRIRCKVVSWHPEVATQLCLASEDDHSPVIQLWDLRFATSPLKTLEHHQRGILSIAWCPQDPDLLLSCGKDNKILCWNPNSNIQDGEVVCELPTSDQWSFDVSWCPRNPAVIASSSFDGHVSVYSLMGGQQQIQPSSKLAESFPGSDAFAQPPVQQSTQHTVSVSLKKPPKWLRKPVGASFGFGGRLVTFVHELPQPHHGQPGHPVPPIHQVYISQIVTEPEVLNRATQLESALNTSNLADFCHKKVQAITDSYKQLAWNFLQANFDQSPRASMLSLLGYDPQDVNMQINTMIKKNESKVDNNENSVDDDMSNKISSLSTDVAEEGDEGSLLFDDIASKEENVDLTPMTIKTDKDDIDGMLSRALLTGNVAAAVQLCLKDERWADAIILAQAGGQSLLQQTQKCYFKAMHSDSVKLISAVVTSDWNHVVDHCDIDCWKEALAAVLAFAKPEEFTVLCETLGGRLEAEKNRVMIQNAMLCYICAGNYEKLANCWVRTQNKIDSPDSLQELVEQVMVLRKAVELMGGQSPQLKTGTLSSLLGRYAALLAAQGSLSSAVTYLVDTSEPSLALLQDRIYQCLGLQSPNCPFQHVEIKSAVTSEQQVSQNKQQTQSQVVSQVPTMPQATSYSTQFPSVSSYGYPPTTMTQYQAPAPSSPLGPPMSPVSPSMQQSSQPAAAPPPPPPLSSNQSSLNQPHHISQRYPRHLHDPSVYQDPQYHSNFYSSVQYEYSQNQVPYSQTGYFQPQSVQQSYYNPGQSYGAPGSTYTIANTPASVYQTANYGTSATMPHSSPANPMMLTHSSGGSYEMSKPGWNDPPLLKHTAKQQPSNFEASPITAPIIGGQTSEPLLPPMVSGGSNYMVPSYPPVPDSNPQLYNPQTQPAPQKTIPEPPKEKGPIPPEHQVLQDIFEDLRNQCQQVATNPQTRRKLDDVARKLENLYDMLRQNALSSGTILGLHQIVQVIQQGDYQTALGVHSQLVSSTNFSETSCFLPGLKVLLQVAQQLSVYLQ